MGPLIMSLQGTSVSARERDLLRHPMVGGVIFFSRNYDSKEQLIRLISQAKEISPDLVLAVDHEGGRVQRFTEGFTRLPPMQSFGRLFERDPRHALQLIYATGHLVATELGEVGIHTGLSPVLDLAGGNAAIGDRALHGSVDTTVKLARQFILGLIDGGLLPVGKHFPGHGTVSGDTHVAVVEDHREFRQIAANDLRVFSELIADKLLFGIMPAHVVYPRVDPFPAGASEMWLGKILRDKLGFDGIILSDDLAMSGIRAKDGKVSAKRILEAGCDMVLVCNDPQLLQTALDECSGSWVERRAHTLETKWNTVYQTVMGKTTEKPFSAEATRSGLDALRTATVERISKRVG